MALPKWNDPELKAGTKIRTALWLMSEVGLGNSFTKEQHRLAFVGVTQADRRLRDLRAYGWVIHTSAEDLTLNPEEQRFVAVGAPVWERGIGKIHDMHLPTAKMRRTAFAENDYLCVVCGIAGGESYPDAPHITAVLALSRQVVTDTAGQKCFRLVPECRRCRSASLNPNVGVSELIDRVEKLEGSDRQIFLRWTEQGRRSNLDRLWADYRRLPIAVRIQVRERIASAIARNLELDGGGANADFC